MPECIQAALRRLVGTYRAERLLVAGAMLEPEQALRVGLVDELADAEQVVARALAWLGELLKLPPHAMRATRRLARADLAAVFAEPDEAAGRGFLDGWYAPETQAVLKALVARLKSKT